MCKEKELKTDEMEKVSGGVWRPQFIHDPMDPKPDPIVPKMPNSVPNGVPQNPPVPKP